jgi:restriction system protein
MTTRSKGTGQFSYGEGMAAGRQSSSSLVRWLDKEPPKASFVTTSFFTEGATEYAARIPQRVVLLDGEELTRLMVRYGVGVSNRAVIGN